MGKTEGRFICMWLEGPMQSWGVNSKFYRKTTLNFPSKSALLGMLLSAMGKKGEQVELLSLFNGLDLQIKAYSKDGDETTNLEDFQIIGGGYNPSDKWQSLMIPKTGAGKAATGVSGAKLMHKHYLQDICYGVVLEMPSEELACEARAFLNAPIYDVFLGRRACLPTEFIYQGVKSNASDGFEALDLLADEKGLGQAFFVRQGEFDGAEILYLNDQPLNFGDFKEYKQRAVSVFY